MVCESFAGKPLHARKEKRKEKEKKNPIKNRVLSRLQRLLQPIKTVMHPDTLQATMINRNPQFSFSRENLHARTAHHFVPFIIKVKGSSSYGKHHARYEIEGNHRRTSSRESSIPTEGDEGKLAGSGTQTVKDR